MDGLAGCVVTILPLPYDSRGRVFGTKELKVSAGRRLSRRVSDRAEAKGKVIRRCPEPPTVLAESTMPHSRACRHLGFVSQKINHRRMSFGANVFYPSPPGCQVADFTNLYVLPKSLATARIAGFASCFGISQPRHQPHPDGELPLATTKTIPHQYDRQKQRASCINLLGFVVRCITPRAFLRLIENLP